MLETEQIYLKHQIFREIFTDFWKNWQKKKKRKIPKHNKWWKTEGAKSILSN